MDDWECEFSDADSMFDEVKRLRAGNKPQTLDFVDNGTEQLFLAKTPFVDYEIFEGRGGWCAEYKFGTSCIPLNRKTGVSKEMAMKICQEDFNTRVLKCIQ